MEINRDEIRKIAVEAEMLQRMQKSLRDQLVALNMSSLEASVTINSIEKIKGDDNAFVSLGSGVFASAKIVPQEYVLVDIGGGIYGEFTREKAVEILKKRIEDTRKLSAKLEEDLKNAQRSLIELERRARQYIK